MSNRLKFHIFIKAVWLAIGFLIVQQLIVASSTIWITCLIVHIQEGKIAFQFLALYLLSLFLPYFPGAAALIEITKAKIKANVHFVKCFTHVHQGQAIEWADTTQQSNKSSILIGEAPQTISNYLEYIYHFYSSSLNVFFNLLTIALIIEPFFLVSYGVGLIFAFLILKFQSKWKKILSLRAQQGRIKWVSMLMKAWDNVLLNNLYNFKIWENKTVKRSERLISSTVRLEVFSQAVSVGMAFVLLAPSFILVCYFAVTRISNLTWLAMMVVTLPRLFQVLTYSYEMLFVLSELPMQKSRLQTVTKLLEVTDLADKSRTRMILENRIQWDKIHISSDTNMSFSAKQLLEILPKRGRITLQGENGCGKTSLFLLIKLLKGDSAFYLPAKHHLAFQTSMKQLSTGQIVRKTLIELINEAPCPLIILDEWDANLDRENSTNLSQMIDKLAKQVCVLESRHIRVPPIQSKGNISSEQYV